MTDWADEEAEKLHELVIRQYRWDDSLKLSGKIAAALRSAESRGEEKGERRGRVAGLREAQAAAGAFKERWRNAGGFQDCYVGAANIHDAIRLLADRVEKGE
jgi:hypothetical protein